jgi:hypothetical protein
MKDKDLLFLDKYDFQHPTDLLNSSDNKVLAMMKPKYKQYRANFLIFDDLVGDPRAFKRNNGRLNNLTIKCRHHHCSMLFTTQYPKAIPPTIRANIDIWVLFRFASKERVLEQVYPEISSLITLEHFEELYSYATKTSAHDALVIDGTNGKIIFKNNFDHLLSFS